MHYKNMVFLVFVSISIPAVAGIKCTDLKYGNEKYQENMEELAKQAHLQDNYYNRFHEDAVKFLCAGEAQKAQELVDEGTIKISEIEAIKKIIGYKDAPEKETVKEKTESVVSNEQLEHAKNQISEAMKDPRKVRLMECMGVNPWEVQPAGWEPPTDEECNQIKKSLNSEVNPSQDTHVASSPDEKWQTVQSNGREIYVKMNGMYYTKKQYGGYGFSTYIVANLPESTIVGAPQSVINEVEGNCDTGNYHVRGSLFYSGKDRSGYPMQQIPPEDVQRKLVPNSPFEKAFNMLCKIAREK